MCVLRRLGAAHHRSAAYGGGRVRRACQVGSAHQTCVTTRAARVGHAHPARFACIALAIALAVAGCARRRTVVELFPVGSQAAPWIQSGDIWSGSFDAAAPGLGNDAAALRPFAPRHVWLGIYKHDSYAARQLTARVFSFDSPARAAEALRVLAPGARERFDAGDEGVWTDDGVAFRQGRLLFDLFGSRTDQVAIPEQAVYLSAYFEKQLTHELAENPK